ncbi:MAG TPA: 16S rRNA (cytidine(1402)-2'-O)-methyltransferase [Candidatus Polarisedimenticolia bacterium]|jgi:16S rRNA (cytidine1402-2'-O)-methyltransferase
MPDGPPGTLHVVATPLGNLQDVTPRALEALRGARLIACEDTRRTRGLLARFGIRPTRLISCHKFNEASRLSPILDVLRQGGCVALVSDGGTPGVSDPGAPLVRAALEARIPVSPIPGPSAAAAAISVCGFAASSFHFAGFLPPRSGARRRAIEALRPLAVPIVLFEAPHRVAAAVADLHALLGDRRITLVREATKIHEEVLGTTLAELAARLREEEARGEFTLVVEGATAGEKKARPEGSVPEAPTPDALRERHRRLVESGAHPREALKALVRETGLPRARVYAAIHLREEEGDP